MQKKIAAILFSTRLTAILFIVFAAAMATGTFMDASAETSPTPYSRELIYNAWWFELIMLLFVINFIGNIFRFRLYRKEKWTTLILHLSFILILVGAFVTRYIGYEGRMSIREGATENTFLSEHTYLSMFIDGDYKVNGVQMRRNVKPKRLRLSERLDNDFTLSTDYNEQPVTVRFKEFFSNAKEGLIADEAGEEYLKIVEAGDGSRHEHWLKRGELANVHNILFAFDNRTEGAINILTDSISGYNILTPFEGNYLRMADQQEGNVAADSLQKFNLRSLYQMAGTAFVIPEPVVKGRMGLIKADNQEKTNKDALLLEVSSEGETSEIQLLGGQGSQPNPKRVTVGGLDVYLSYGSKSYELPFSITLNDFIADKYPGTENSYSAFKSKITVNDSDTEFFDFDIYMNHVLDHKGYRFFQASFDPDEKGTVLSVNHDWWGTWITYIGYFLLYMGLMGILFDRNTRFGALKRMLDKVKDKKKKLATVLLLLISTTLFSQQTDHFHTETNKQKIDSVVLANAVPKEHAAKFSRLVIQDNGRMKPIHTYASELLRKISKRNSYEGLDANQVFLSMTEFPRLWLDVPIVSLKRGNDSLRKVLGVPLDARYIAMTDLFDEQGNNKLEPYLEEASRKTNPNQFEKDFIKTYESVYLLNQTLSGSILKIFPIPNDKNNRWVSYLELNEANFKGMDSVATRTILPAYFQTIVAARESGDFTQPEELLEGITSFQRRYGAEVMPTETKVSAEIAYNRADIFNRLYKYFTLIGVLMFVFIVARIFRETRFLNVLIKGCKFLIWAFFILMTVGLAMRWYISGHAPWSDAYESIIYVGWATVFFGLAFGRKSHLTIASTAFVAAIILWVANQNWLDPSIANLQPVLDSYWLMIHVAVIVASYGPFTLGMILGATALLLMILTNKRNFKKMELNIREITVINEMALTVGLVMLTIGNFLGGQWANESWGRYWGWDPKETWALISIMIYAFVIHIRLVPGLRSRWLFNVLSLFAYASIMMTYFGVNFYLVGLHSYASGDVPVTPRFVWYIVAAAVLLSFFGYLGYRKYYTKKG